MQTSEIHIDMSVEMMRCPGVHLEMPALYTESMDKNGFSWIPKRNIDMPFPFF